MIEKAITIYRKLRSKHALKAFRKTFDHFNSLDTSKKLPNDWKDIYPCLIDDTKETSFDAHYLYHPAWAARIVRQVNPQKHIDISSTLNFCSILSAFVPVEFYDYRPAIMNLSHLSSGTADLTQLHFESGSITSLSCMHTVEHVGLGRYGDPIDPDGDIKAIFELQRVVSVSGSLLFVVPVGKPKVIFNAHRIYDPGYITGLFDAFTLKKFSLVTDGEDFLDDADLNKAKQQNYGCGCFWFIKNNSTSV